jgi:hypothetical protein
MSALADHDWPAARAAGELLNDMTTSNTLLKNPTLDG